MRVLIVGLPLFAKRLRDDLVEFDPDNTYFFLDTYYNKWDRYKALFLIPYVDIIYSINGTLDKSRVFDLAFFLQKRVMMTWVGTDVLKAKELKKVNNTYLNRAEHYCEVIWIQDELKELNIDAKILNFFNFSGFIKPVMPHGKNLKVLMYISANRAAYYGWNEIIDVAKMEPGIEFIIVGTDGSGDIPSNVKCLGWVDDLDELYNDCHCTIRFVKHDGLSGFVLESLVRGKQVIYSEPLEHCHYVKNSQQISDALTSLQKQLLSGSSLFNVKGAEYVRNNFGRKFILGKLVETFNK
jgi:hypothetical protein